MGCTSSNSNSAVAGNNNRPSRPANTTTVPVQRPGLASRPLMKSKNFRHGSPLTQRDLQQMRDSFWASRTEGNPQMWQNIRSVAEALAADDLMLANAILEASNIVSPTGVMDTLYDERGAQYKIPVYCFSNPVELCGDSPNSPSPAVVATPAKSADGSSPVRGDSLSNAAPKGDGKPLNLKIRINPGDINLAVKAQTNYTIADLKSSIVKHALQAPVPMPEIREDKQRIIFMGRELQNAQKLSDVGFDEQKVVQVFLRPGK